MNRFSIYLVFFIFTFLSFYIYANRNIDLKITYLYPTPNSTEARPTTPIIVNIDPNISGNLNSKLLAIQIEGSESGSHQSEIKIKNKTFIVTPIQSFKLGEKVTVNIQVQILGNSNSVNYSFLISEVESFDENILSFASEIPKVYKQNLTVDQKVNTDPIVINGVSVPGSFPILVPAINNSVSPGKLFMTNYSGDVFYLMIFEKDGTPYYYKKLPEYSVDFKLQENGILTRFSLTQNGFLLLNDQYEEIGLVQAQNGYFTDPHDFLITKDSTFLLIGLGTRVMDMSEIVEGGQSNAKVVENIIQELDSEQNIIFEWRSLDPNNYDDVTSAIHANLTSKYFEPSHVNSLAIDYDDNIIISSRHRSECTKIDRKTGNVIWRFGGVKNQFNIVNDEKPISFQHTFYPVIGKPNHYTIFDNGNFSDKISRAIEYKLDPNNLTAEKIWEYIHEDNLYAFRAGNAQRLSNGNTLINFVHTGNSKAVEVDSTGMVVYEADIDPSLEIHRTFLFDWESEQSEPYLITELFENKVRLLFNKFGDSDVSSYNIYGGINPQEITLMGNTIEPWWELEYSNVMQGTNFYFNVTSINSSGTESNFSNTESILINNPGNGNSLGILGNSEFEDIFDPIWIESQTPFNNALSFTKSDQLVNCGNDPTIQLSGSELTIQANIFPTSFDEEAWQNVIVSKERGGNGTEFGYSLRSGGNGIIEFLIGDGSWKILVTPPGTVKINEWNIVSATYDGQLQRIYVNNLLSAEASNTTQITDASNSNFIIGNSSFYPSRAYAGNIDEVRLWNRTLSENDILALMNSELGPEYYSNPKSGLVAYWQLNEGAGQITVDLAKENNIVLNGDFSLGDNYWNLISENSVLANGSIGENDYYFINIENGGSFESSVRLSQNNILLVSNISYILEFDAWSAQPKFIKAAVRQSDSPWRDYSKIGAVYITESLNHFEYQFNMADNTNNNSEITFMLGGNNIDFFIDNVSLKIDDLTKVTNEERIITKYELKENYPNPFNPNTTIGYNLPKESRVKISVYNILGEIIINLVNEIQAAGNYNKIVEMKNFSSGIYFYSISAESILDNEEFHKVNKMILLK